MKTPMQKIISAALGIGLIFSAMGQQTDNPPQPAPPAIPSPGESPRPAEPLSENEKGIRFNFRGVPLEMVLNYLSEAAGFIIVLETRVEGRVDAWSNQPLTKNEAVELLNTVLNRNGYAAIRSGRTLKIVSRDEAKTKDIPVRSGSDPEVIPKSDEMVTQIIPVRYANAVQMVQNLTPLLATYATLSANESGNALVLTGTQSDVRRMAEIVKALDTSISSVSSIRVFPLRFADAKAMADAVKELFQPPTGQNNNDRRNQFFNRFFRGGRDGGGPGIPGGPPGATGNSPAATANSRVTAVADERANALVVSAPDDVIPTIEKLVQEMDVSISDVTELRVFRLVNSDPLELADVLAELFPDETRTGNNNNQQQDFRFGGGGGNRRGNNANNSNTSERMKRKGRVISVADQRTSSLIVTADSELMPQIAAMIEQLDSNPAKRQKVYVYSLENADVQQVEQIVRDMFDRSNTGNRNNSQQNSPLLNRSQQNQQSVPGNTIGTGGFGGQGAGGGQRQNFP